jgi:large subunit ribosomal protein L3
MSIIVGKKIGMTEMLTADGRAIASTVLELLPNKVAQLKSEGAHYHAVQIAYGSKRKALHNMPEAGHLAKAGIESALGLIEFRVEASDLENYKLGDDISLEPFAEGAKVHVQGVTKGKGFAGGVKRHGFKMQDATHGNSVSHRAIGSTGQCQDPGKVFKGKKMAGHMGATQVTIKNLNVVKIDAEAGILVISGAIPGAPGGIVIVEPQENN